MFQPKQAMSLQRQRASVPRKARPTIKLRANNSNVNNVYSYSAKKAEDPIMRFTASSNPYISIDASEILSPSPKSRVDEQRELSQLREIVAQMDREKTVIYSLQKDKDLLKD